MDQKPEIQYIGQFYVHGSEARKLSVLRPARKASKSLPEAIPQQQRVIRVDPMAVVGIVVAVALLVVLASGALKIRSAWREYAVMERYLTELKDTNTKLEHTYRSGFDLEEIELKALALGMVPASEVSSFSIRVTLPQPEEEPAVWDEVLWFVKGLFS